MNTIPVESDEISPNNFFENYVSKRKPAKILGHIKDKSWNAKSWTCKYLLEKCGSVSVQVERKKENSFGKGVQEEILFKDFINHLNSGDESLYLTTQDLTYSSDDQPILISQPVLNLVDDIPSIPSIMGHLIPQNVNLWMGATSQETSSGLHHDYHDNLYILLHGIKRIFLYPPTLIDSMYTYGKIHTVYDNGRIVYESQTMVRADGASILSEKAYQASVEVELAASRVYKSKSSHRRKENDTNQNDYKDNDDDNGNINKNEVEDYEDDYEEEDEEAEEALESALDHLLDIEREEYGLLPHNTDDYDDDDDDDDDDDYDEEGDGLGDDFNINDVLSDDDDDDEEEEEEEEEYNNDHGKNTATSSKTHNNSNNKRSLSTLHTITTTTTTTTKKQKNASSSSSSSSPSSVEPPLNFSRIREHELSKEQLQALYPKYVENKDKYGYEVIIHAGEMLYIPAGWFHEVFSCGKQSSSSTTTTTSHTCNSNITNTSSSSSTLPIIKDTIHMALNYWFHPPDNSIYEQPYKSSFWKDDWIRRGCQLKPL